MSRHRFIQSSAQLNDVVDQIGEDAFTRLCEALGGTRIYVPRTIGATHPIALAIGAAAARQLADYFHGCMLDLPKARLRIERAVELVRDAGLSIGEAARMTDYSQRHLRRVLNTPDDHDQLTFKF